MDGARRVPHRAGLPDGTAGRGHRMGEVHSHRHRHLRRHVRTPRAQPRGSGLRGRPGDDGDRPAGRSHAVHLPDRRRDQGIRATPRERRARRPEGTSHPQRAVCRPERSQGLRCLRCLCRQLGACAAGQPHPASRDAAERSASLGRRPAGRDDRHPARADRRGRQGCSDRPWGVDRLPDTAGGPDDPDRQVRSDRDGADGLPGHHRPRRLAALGDAGLPGRGCAGGASAQRRPSRGRGGSGSLDAPARPGNRHRAWAAPGHRPTGGGSGRRHESALRHGDGRHPRHRRHRRRAGDCGRGRRVVRRPLPGATKVPRLLHRRCGGPAEQRRAARGDHRAGRRVGLQPTPAPARDHRSGGRCGDHPPPAAIRVRHRRNSRPRRSGPRRRDTCRATRAPPRATRPRCHRSWNLTLPDHVLTPLRTHSTGLVRVGRGPDDPVMWDARRSRRRTVAGVASCPSLLRAGEPGLG